MTKTLTTIIFCIFAIGFITPSTAEALSIKIEPSLFFGQFFGRVQERPARVVHHQEVYIYNDPYTHQDYYYNYPVTREYIEYTKVYPQRHYRSTNVGVGVRVR